MNSAAARQTADGRGRAADLASVRDKFADLLLDEVVNSLDRPTPDHLEEELIDLGLLEYCRPALETGANPEILTTKAQRKPTIRGIWSWIARTLGSNFRNKTLFASFIVFVFFVVFVPLW